MNRRIASYELLKAVDDNDDSPDDKFTFATQ